jgi:hypothetical protein
VAPIVPAAPTPFTDDIMTAIGDGIDPSGYQLSYPVFIASLQPSLLHHYSPPGAARAAPAAAPVPAAAAPGADPVAAAVPGGDPVTAELARIKAYLNHVAQPGRRPPGFDVGRVNNLVNRARDSVPVTALGRAAPFDVAAYRVAVLAYLNANAPAGFNFASVGP